MKNIDLLRVLSYSQMCCVEVSPHTAGELRDKRDTIILKQSLFEDHPTYFIMGTAATLICLAENRDDDPGNINLRWSEVYKTYIEDGRIYIFRYEETYQKFLSIGGRQ